ncbi:LysM peptidoglycan-binding domain-containing protein [Streptomyces spinosirectus]
MPTHSSPAQAATRALARVLTAAVSLLVLSVAIVGLPLLLAWATPVIWSATHDDALHLLDRQDTGGVFLLLLVAVGWIGWAQFTFCAVRELIAQLRGRTWHAPRGLGASQRAAALLIGSILVLLPTSSALASDAQAAPATTAARLPGRAQSPQAAVTEQAPTAAASTPASRTTYTVRETRPAQSLWGIAERELGDGERWREIADLNDGHTMTDGTVFRANSFLQPGWQLQMPDTTAAAEGIATQGEASNPAAHDSRHHVVTVHSGDYLSKIAEKELGDGDQWPALFKASQGTPQPHGLPEITDPDVIRPGQQVTVPATSSGQPPPDRGPGQESDDQGTTPPTPQHPGGTGSTQAPTPRQHQAPAPQSTAPTAPTSRPAEQPGQDDQPSPPATASPTPKPSTSTSAPPLSPPASAPVSTHPSRTAAPAPETPPTTPAGSLLNLRIVLGAGALLTAAITAALALRRTLQRRRRRPGETIAIASEGSPAEAQLAAAAKPGGAARLDVTLRTLAHHLAQQQQEEDRVPPLLRAARVGNRTVHVLPEDLAHEPLEPFTSGQGGWWALPADAALLDDETAREVPAPYPGLVTIGHTKTGDLVLLNLTQLPTLLLDGSPVHITEVCTSLALELAMSPWATDVEVVTVGFGEDLPQLLPTARIAHLRHATHALRDLSERLLEAHQIPETQHQPYLLLCASTLDEDTAWQLADVIDRAGAVPVTLIAPASTAATHFPDATILNASLSTPQRLDYAGTDLTVQRLDHAAYHQITTALKVSGQPPHPAEGPWRHIPDEPYSKEPPEHASPQEPTAHTPAASPPSPAGATDRNSDVFPALLGATTDPSAPRLPTPAATAPPIPTAPAAADTTHPADAVQDRGPRPSTQESAGQETENRLARDLLTPEIRVLGPVEVTGVDSTGHGPRMAQLAALLYFRPGRSAHVLCAAMDPASPWSTSTLNARMQGLRSCLGSDPSGTLYVPRRKSGEDPYRLAPGVRCDWTRFLHLVEHALPLGPAGLDDLESALTLVRGKPFDGRPLPWAEPHYQDMLTRITDTAHTVATHRTAAGPHHDLNAARHAVATGLEVDETAELLYRDWMRLEAARGNRAGLHTAITRVQHVNRALDCSLETETEQLINELLGSTSRDGAPRR